MPVDRDIINKYSHDYASSYYRPRDIESGSRGFDGDRRWDWGGHNGGHHGGYYGWYPGYYGGWGGGGCGYGGWGGGYYPGCYGGYY